MSDQHRITVSRATTAGVARLWRGCHSRTDTYQPGVWIVHCQLCKDRIQFDDYDTALEFARVDHFKWPAHQRWTGVIALGGELPIARGYDSTSCRQSRNNIISRYARARSGYRLWAETRGEEPPQNDDLAARRVAPPPRVTWTVGQPLGPVAVTWEDGSTVGGTLYKLYANGAVVADIVSIIGGGWLFNGRYMDDATLTNHLEAA